MWDIEALKGRIERASVTRGEVLRGIAAHDRAGAGDRFERPWIVAIESRGGSQIAIDARQLQGVRTAHAEADRANSARIDLRSRLQGRDHRLQLAYSAVAQRTDKYAIEDPRQAQRANGIREQVDRHRDVSLTRESPADVPNVVVQTIQLVNDDHARVGAAFGGPRQVGVHASTPRGRAAYRERFRHRSVHLCALR